MSLARLRREIERNPQLTLNEAAELAGMGRAERNQLGRLSAAAIISLGWDANLSVEVRQALDAMRQLERARPRGQ